MADLIAALHPTLRPLFRFIEDEADRIAFQHGKRARFTTGLRTKAQQDALYAKGRTAPGAIVTHVKGGYSFHNYGCAADLGVFTEDFAKYLGSDPLYDTIGQTIVKLNIPGVIWGGDFPKYFGGTFRDRPHFQFGPPAVRSAMVKYVDRPYDLPLTAPALPSDPVTAAVKPSKEFQDAWAVMLREKIYTEHTKPSDVLTADRLAVVLTRFYDAVSRHFEPKR